MILIKIRLWAECWAIRIKQEYFIPVLTEVNSIEVHSKMILWTEANHKMIASEGAGHKIIAWTEVNPKIKTCRSEPYNDVFKTSGP